VRIVFHIIDNSIPGSEEIDVTHSVVVFFGKIVLIILRTVNISSVLDPEEISPKHLAGIFFAAVENIRIMYGCAVFHIR